MEKTHVKAFAAASKKDSDGLTVFQRRALEAISPFVNRDDFRQVNMVNEDGLYLHASIVDAKVELFFYPDGAQVSDEITDSRFEEWDYRTPSELLDAFSKECASRLA